MRNPLDSEIQSRVQAFASELEELIRASALEALSEALGGTAARPAGRRGGNEAPKATQTTGVPGKRQKRDPDELDALTESLGGFIAKNPGKRIEEIAKSLSTSTKELALPAKKLIASRRVSTRGQRRATTYHPR